MDLRTHLCAPFLGRVCAEALDNRGRQRLGASRLASIVGPANSAVAASSAIKSLLFDAISFAASRKAVLECACKWKESVVTCGRSAAERQQEAHHFHLRG
jgi:hypothetical protein